MDDEGPGATTSVADPARPDFVPAHEPNGAKSTDAWWTVLLVDPIVLPVVRLLTKVPWATPNRITLLANLLSPVAVVLLATGHVLAAAIVYEVRFLIDCVDGKLARAIGSSSATGAYLDPVGDYLTAACLSAALGYHLAQEELLTIGWAILLPSAYFAHFVAIMARHAQANLAGMGKRRPDAFVPAGRYATFMRSHRLTPLPCRIEAEHLFLFVLPLLSGILDEPDLLVWAAGWGIFYGLYRTARVTFAGYLIARSRDRAAVADA